MYGRTHRNLDLDYNKGNLEILQSAIILVWAVALEPSKISIPSSNTI